MILMWTIENSILSLVREKDAIFSHRNNFLNRLAGCDLDSGILDFPRKANKIVGS